MRNRPQHAHRPTPPAPAALVLVALSVTGCASTGAVPRPFPMPRQATEQPLPAGPDAAPPVETVGVGVPAPAVGAIATAPARVEAVLVPPSVTDTALALLGTPYVSGGSTPDGFDCSGFTQWVFGRHGLALPRDTRAQFEAGSEIDAEQVEPGDLMFFRTNGQGVSHVGIALDADRFVHAPNARGVVRVERLSQTYWNRRFVGARRVHAEQ